MALPESNEHIELVDGEVVIMPGPSLLHQLISQMAFRALADWAGAHPPALVAYAPLDVRIGPSRIVQPDLMLWLRPPPLDDRPIVEPPTLCVEILSRHGTYDRIAKRLIYAEGGVAEYWIVDPMARNIEVVRGLATVGFVDGVLTSRELPGFSVGVASLFPAG